MSSAPLKNDDKPLSPINKIIREIAVSSFNEFTGCEGKVEGVDRQDDFVYGFLMTIILTHCDSFDSMFKVHFSVKDAVSITKEATGLDEEDVSEEEAVDFIKEYTNMFAGHFVGDLAQRGIRADISIPVTTSGFDEVTFTDTFYDDEDRDYWKLSYGNHGMVVTTNTKVKDVSIFSDLEKEVLRQKSKPVTFL